MKVSRVKATFHLEPTQTEAMNALSWHRRGILVGMAVRRFLQTHEGRRMLFERDESHDHPPGGDVSRVASPKVTKKHKMRLPLDPKQPSRKTSAEERPSVQEQLVQEIKRPSLQPAVKAQSARESGLKDQTNTPPATTPAKRADFCVIGLNDFFS